MKSSIAPAPVVAAIATAIAAILLAGCVAGTGGPRILPNGGEYGAKWAGSMKRPWPHQGVDYDRPAGAAVLAAADGIVTQATHSKMRDKSRFGCVRKVRIKHTGLADGFETFYCHLGKVFVNFGDEVKRGDVIATIDRPCSAGCVAHLHFEVTARYVRYNPQEKIAGCFDNGKTGPTAEQPLTYPVRC